jgi:heme exporter protein D
MVNFGVVVVVVVVVMMMIMKRLMWRRKTLGTISKNNRKQKQHSRGNSHNDTQGVLKKALQL